ncbi:olfactory receptor 51E1-like [Electrophorus electricus]|uniref:Olfactory receptor n=1 Tax=Electrophorus electricus TaxID=8005 RepID=A0A4W4FGI1_ELEEL|nr:olfactory receptor 51E1-like [Electrophorus electricus]
MDYSRNVTYFTLEGHIELEKYRYVYFIITLIVYLLIIFLNFVVIYVIFTNKCLHEPMYIFIAALLCNTLLGSTVLYPKLLIDFLSETQVVSYEACTFQSCSIYTIMSSEFMLISAMAYDRYVSICKPFQYATLVKISTVKKILFCCWFLPTCENGIALILTHQIKTCKFKLNRIYCNNYVVMKLGCGDISVRSSYGVFVIIVSVCPPVVFIVFSYMKILAISFKNSPNFRNKALRTCLPHIFVFISFTVTSCFEVISSRLESNIPQIIAMILSVENFVIPPLLNPVIYGLKVQEILNRIKIIFWKRKTKIYF